MTLGTQKTSRGMLLLTALLAGIAVIAAPLAAHAHGGPYDLAVSSDAAGGLIVTASYIEDHHPVSEIMDPTATATSTDGDVVGPVDLISSPEGEGVWITREPFIPVGTWSVTVTTSIPSPASTAIQIHVDEPALPIVAPAGGADGSAVEGGVAAASLWGGGVVLVLIVAGGSIALIRRRAERGRGNSTS